GRQRIAHGLERAARADDMRNGLGPDVPGRAVADAVDRSELRIGIGPLALLVVAEAQARAAVVLDLDDEVRLGGAALDEIALDHPDFHEAAERAGERG